MKRPCWLAAVALLALSGCSAPPQQPPHMVLIVVDTLRADRLGAYGSTRGLTPFLDELAARGTVFRNAYATSSWTVPSVASLLTSRIPSQHLVATAESKISDQEVTLPERLKAGGYMTVGFSANLRLSERLGYGRGFAVWHAAERGATKPRGEVLRAESLPVIDERCMQRGAPPCFLYLQYMEPHAPYQPPEPFISRFGRPAPEGTSLAAANKKLIAFPLNVLSDPEVELVESCYDAEVAAVDAELRLMLGELQRRHFLDNAVVVITADHGEEFKEHGWLGHGTALYNETVHVPLILLAPGVSGGRTVDENVSLLDLAPTLLDLAGLPPEPHFEGHSLVPLLQRRGRFAGDAVAGAAQDAQGRNIILELEPTGSKLDLRRHTDGLIDGTTKYLVNRNYNTTEIYDLGTNPREIGPTPSTDDPRTADVQRRLDLVRAGLRTRALAEGERVPLDEATKEKLRALGYQF